MSLWSGLGNIFHGIGSFFEGNDNQDPRKRDQPQQFQQYTPPQPQATNFNAPQPQNNNSPTPKPLDFANLVQLGEGGNTGLQKAPGPLPFLQQQAQPQQVNPQPNPQPVDTSTPPKKASFWHNVTHNPVTNVVGDVVKPVVHSAAEFGNAAIHVPEAIYREVQNKPIDDIQREVFGTNDSGTIAKKIIGDTATLGLTVAAPGVDNLAEAGATSVVPGAAERILTGTALGVRMGLPVDVAEQAAKESLGKAAPALIKAGAGATTGAAINTGFGASQGVEEGQSPSELLQKVPENAAVGAAVGGATPFISGALRKFGGKLLGALRGDPNVPAPDELSTGIKSANPTRNEDAAAVHAQQAQAAAPPAQIPAVTEALQKAGGAPQQTALPLDVAPAKADAQILQPAETPVQQAPAEAPVQAPAQAPTAPLNAPNAELQNSRFSQALQDNAKDPVFQEALKSSDEVKGTTPLKEAKATAINNVQQLTPAQIVQTYGKDFSDKENPISSPQGLYEHLEAIRQLEQMPDDPKAAEAAANALRAINDYGYRSGLGTTAFNIAYDDMPKTMKVAYWNKFIEKAGGSLNPADLERLYTAADLQGKFAKTAAEITQQVHDLASTASEKNPQFKTQMADLLAKEREAQGNLFDQNREVVNIIEKNLPKSSLGDRFAQNARTSMLSSIGGRIFALTGTAFNAANYVADKTLSSIYGRGVNLAGRALGKVTDSNAVKTSFVRPGTLVKGIGTGFKGLAKEVGDNAPVKDVTEYLKKPYDSEYSHDATRYGWIGRNVTAPLRKAVRFGVGTHLAATKGIETAELEQQARQAAGELGIPKENVNGWVDYYKTHAPKNPAEEAKQVWMGVNNLHKNGISDALSGVANKIEDVGGPKAGFVAKQIRTVFLPFSHYMGGFVDKSLTDRNLLYNAYRIARARSPQELSDQLAHATTNLGAAGGLGYLLARNGTITTKDQDGNNYDGLYFHIGDKYIGVEWAGQAAAPIIAGASLYNSMHDGSHGMSFPTSVIDTTLKSTGVAGTFGDTSSTGTLLAGNSGRGGPQIAGTAVRQHIPGVFGDINSFLNYSPLNPTNEKPNTKVTSTNPTTGRENTNVIKTEVAKTEAAIPGLSQQLPRQKGEQAPSFIDRALHAGETSAPQKQAIKDQKATEDHATQDKNAGIPMYNAPKDFYAKGDSFDQAVKNRIENNKYDQAIGGLQEKVDAMNKAPDAVPSEVKKVQNQIEQLKITKDYGDQGQKVRNLYLGTTLSEWRDMGDPNSGSYDPDTYKLLYDYDSKLAKASVAGKGEDGTKNKFYAKTDKTGSRYGKGSKKPPISKTSSPIDLKGISFGDLSPQKIQNIKIPTIQAIPASQLIKKRTISVSKA